MRITAASNHSAVVIARQRYFVKEMALRVRCGCFNGTLEEFAAKVVGTHGNDDFGKVYKAIIEVIKLRFGLNKTE